MSAQFSSWLVSLFIALLLLLPGCGQGTSDDPDGASNDDATTDDDDTSDQASGCEGVIPEVIDLSPDDLSTMMEDKDFLLINVHIPHAGEIPGTDDHIPYNDMSAIEDGLGGALGTKAVLYCLTGPMSVIATEALVDDGYCRIYDLPSGMVGWEASGYTIDP